MTQSKMKKYVDVTYLIWVINYNFMELLSNHRPCL